MGPKITIDSATLMNKGLEVIEAHWLFGAPAAQISVVVHPQSIVHSIVELKDGSMIAQMGTTDMRLPIQYAFSYPDRWDAPVPFLDLTRCGPLTFEEPAWADFPCLRLAYRALEAERSLPIVLNAANEVAVASFLEGRLGFTDIPRVIAETHGPPRVRRRPTRSTQVRRVDDWARDCATELVQRRRRRGDAGRAVKSEKEVISDDDSGVCVRSRRARVRARARSLPDGALARCPRAGVLARVSGRCC